MNERTSLFNTYFIEYLLCVSHCSWHWENSSEHNKVPVLVELIFHSMSERVNKEANTISQLMESVM